MSNVIPPLISDSPPPPPSEEDEDEEYDVFRGSNDISYGCDSFSSTPSPDQSPKKVPKEDSSSTEFKFQSVTPEEAENIEVETFKTKDLDKELSNQAVLEVPVEPLKHSELSCSESSDKLTVDITTNVFHKNNYNKDNIPSQFIIKSQNVNRESDVRKCDNQNEKITEDLHELHIKGENMAVVEMNLSNGFVDSEEKMHTFTKSTSEDQLVTENSDYTSGHTSSTDFLSKENYESNPDLEIPVSNDKEFSSVSTKSNKEFDFSTNILNDVNEENIFDADTKFDSNVGDNFSSQLIHSNNDLVNCETVELSKSIANDENFKKKVKNPDTDTYHNGEKIIETSNKLNVGSVSACDLDASKPENSNNLSENEEEFASFDFHPIESSQSPPNDDNIQIENDDDFDNFSSFPITSTSNQDEGGKIGFNAFPSTTSHDTKNEIEDGFASFASFPIFESPENLTVKNHEDFDEFTSFSVNSTKNTSDHQISDDEFDDFGEFTSTTIETSPSFDSIQKAESSSKPFLLIDEKEAFRKTEEIVKDIFVLSEEAFEDFQYFELGKGDNIFTQLQDVTDTPALGYSWSKSTSQKVLLKSLNIDSRNILYGHSWNSSVPRFAANLGVQPLEPVKMEPLTPTPAEPIPSAIQRSHPETVEVPTAEFDWSSAGLVNPLDYCQTTLLDLEQLVASLDIPNTNPIPQHTNLSPIKFEEDWDDWLKYAPSESTTQSAKSEPVHPPQPNNDDYEEFTSFQSSKPSAGWPSVPLRETYISEVPQAHIDIDVVLQPTIVTPELPRKIISTEDVAGFGETLSEVKIEPQQDDDEEFDDFQMVPPVNKTLNEGDKSSVTPMSENLKNNNVIIDGNPQAPFTTVPFEATNIPAIKIEPKTTDDDFTEFHSSSVQAAIVESQNTGTENNDDDDFTEFHSSVPLPQPQATSVLAPVLQPTPMYTAPKSTQINWPDPGITHDELKRFEEAFSTPLAQKKEEKSDVEPKISETVAVKPADSVRERNSVSIWDSPVRSNPIKKPDIKEQFKKLESKQNSVDDDEWSDFVSVQKPSPVHKTKLLDRTQTSSPDLPLSVLNLGNIQPAKQPIPVITPHGLVQTKLSTNMNPGIQPKPVNTRSSYDLPQIRPSIISNQYASQAYGFGAIPQSSQTVQNGQDDDEWGEFVSSRPLPPQYQNSSTTVGHHGWSNFSPNHQSNHRTVNTNLQKKSSNLSGLVLPELDFLALKERTGAPRKK